MRTLIITISAMGFWTASTFAQEKQDGVQKLEGEVARLRDENAQLQKLVKQFVDATAEAKKLEGSWVIETARMNGKDVMSDKGGEIEFIGNAVVARMPGKKQPIHHIFGIVPGAKQLSFRPLSKTTFKATGTSFDRGEGMYALDGDTLRVSLQSVYTIPTEVSDKEQVLWVLKRKKS